MDINNMKDSLISLAKKSSTAQSSSQLQESTTQKEKNPQVVYSWEAPARAYKKHSKGVLRFYTVLALLLSFIVYFFREYVLILPIWSIMFLIYMLTITPAHIVRHSITKFGLIISQAAYRWEDLSHFYFIHKFGYDILVIFTHNPYRQPLYAVLDSAETKKRLIKDLSEKIVYVEYPRKTLTDKLAEWLSTFMPEEENQVDSLKHEGKSLSHQTSAPKG